MELEKAVIAIKDGYGLPEQYFTADIGKAYDVGAVRSALGLEQLVGNKLKQFYVDTDEVRGENTLLTLTRMLDNELNPYTKILFSGFTGSGKTTELLKLYDDLKDKHNIIIFSALTKLKLEDINIESLIFEIIEDLLNYISLNELIDEGDEVLNDAIENISAWASKTEIISEDSTEKSASMGGQISFLKIFFAGAKAEFLSGERRKTTTVERHKLTDLIFECNKLLDYLRSVTGKDLTIIVDDLEKIEFTHGKDFFVDSASFLSQFRCKMLLTIPVELIYHPDYANLQGKFGEAEVLPMLKVRDKDGEPYTAGIEVLEEMIASRIDLSLFENGCYKKAIQYSGGSIRDMFRILQRAALVEPSDMITEKSMNKSINNYRISYESRIQESRSKDAVPFRGYLDVLFDIFKGNKKRPEKTRALLDLLRTRAVMKYNGEGFFDTHPLLDDFIQQYMDKDTEEGK